MAESPTVYDMPSEQEMLRTVLVAAVLGDQGAIDWLLGKCTIGISQHGYYLGYTLGRGRASYDVTIWRTAVFARDDYACQDCGARDRLHAHHVEHWADAPERRFDIDNGLTLCPECHAARHPEHANLIRKSPAHG